VGKVKLFIFYGVIFLGALAFMILVIIGLLFLAGLVVILAGIIFAVVFKIKSKKSQSSKIKYRLLPIIFLCSGIVILIIPITIVLVMRGLNEYTYIGYVNTGILTYYDEVNIDTNDGNYSIGSEDYINSFTINNTDYIRVNLTPNMDINKISKLKAVANAKVKQSNFPSFLSFVFNKNDIDTIYSVKSNSNLEILYSSQGELYCKKTDSEKVINFYNDMGNYNWEICDGIRYENSKLKSVIFNSEKLNELYKFSQNDFSNKGVFISSDYSEKTLAGVSKDSLNCISFELLKSENKIYYVIDDNFTDENNTSIWVFPLDKSLSDYFNEFF
jgi:hypothetical protein